jgi:hypothetical protein
MARAGARSGPFFIWSLRIINLPNDVLNKKKPAILVAGFFSCVCYRLSLNPLPDLEEEAQ